VSHIKMRTMSESFVDLSYRGLALGKRIKLTQIRPGSGFLEIPTPMPVGTLIGIASDDGVSLEAIVAEVNEQVGGRETPPGMLVKPTLDDKAADTWWRARASGVDPKPERSVPAADAAGKVTVMSPRMTGEVAVPKVVDDGHNTAVMEAVSDETSSVDTLVADVPLPRDTNPNVPMPRDTAPDAPQPEPPAEEASRTMMMDAVDLAALGLTTGSGQMAAVKPEDYADEDPGSSSPGVPTANDKPEASGTKKKKRKRR